jgi:hydrogenase expression/formation protein HypC
MTEATVAAPCRRPVAWWRQRVPANDGGLALGQAGGRAHDRRGLMCLAIPGKVMSFTNDDPLMRTARVDFGGIVKEINLAFTPEAGLGDYVLVHVGFAITVIDEAEAARVFEHLERIGEIEAELASGRAP